MNHESNILSKADLLLDSERLNDQIRILSAIENLNELWSCFGPTT